MARLKVTPEPVPVHAPVQMPTPPIEEHNIIGVGSLMISSLPPMASGADVYLRQFYRSTKLPQRRFLPLTGL